MLSAPSKSALLALCATFTLLGSPAAGQDISWSVAADGLWTNAGNWSGGVPSGTTGTRDVYIAYAPYPLASSLFTTTFGAGAGTVEINRLFSGANLTMNGSGTILVLNGAGSVIERGLTLSNGTLRALGSLTVQGLTRITGGAIDGTGSLSFLGGLEATSASISLVDRSIVVAGTSSVSSNQIRFGGSTVSIAGDFSYSGSNIYEGLVTLTGTFRKTGGGSATIAANFGNLARSFINQGLVRVESGSLFHAGATTGTPIVHSGDWVVEAGANLTMLHAAEYGASVSFSGAGGLALNQAAQTFAAGSRMEMPFRVTGATAVFSPGSVIANRNALTVSSGTLTLDTGDETAWNSLNLTGGTLNGSDDLEVLGSASMGNTTIAGSGRADFRGATSFPANTNLDRPVTFHAGASVTGNQVRFYGHPVLFPTGTTLILAANTINLYEGQTVLDGMLDRTTGTGTVRIGANFGNLARSFDNRGLVRVQTGTLQVEADGAHSGDFEVFDGAVLDFRADVTMLNGSEVTGAGSIRMPSGTTTWRAGSRLAVPPQFAGATVRFESGSVLDWAGVLTLSSGLVQLSSGLPVRTFAGALITGGIVEGAEPLEFTGPATLQSTTIRGGGTLRFRQGATGTGSIQLERTTQFEGNSRLVTSAQFRFRSNPVTLAESATLTLENSTVVYEGNLVNQGRIERSGGTATARLGANFGNEPRSFVNEGEVVVTTGQLSLEAEGRHTGSFAVAADSLLRAGSAMEFANGATVAGGGSFAADGNPVRFTSGATFSLDRLTIGSAGLLRLESNAVLAGSPALTINGGALDSGRGSTTTFGALTVTGGATLGGVDELVIEGPTSVSGTLTVGGGPSLTFRGPFAASSVVNLGRRTIFDGDATLSVNSGFRSNGHPMELKAGRTMLFDATTAQVNYEGDWLIEGTIRSTNTSRVDFLANFSNELRRMENRGLIDVRASSFRIVGAVTNYDHTLRRLTGGGWRAANGSALQFSFPFEIRTNAADIALDGAGSRIVDINNADALANLDTNVGSLTLSGGRNLPVGPLTNSGRIAIGAATTLSSTGLFLQTAGNTSVGGTLGAASVQVDDGNLSGDGFVAAPVVQNGGQISAGREGEVGALGLGQSFVQNGGVIAADLATPNEGEHDRLFIAAHANFGGGLDVRMVPGAVAEAGHRVRIAAIGGARSGVPTLVADPADWEVLAGTGFLDVRARRRVASPVQVRGRVELGDWSASIAGVQVEIEVRQSGVAVQSLVVPLQADGSFSFPSTRREGADVSFRAGSWLRRTLTGLTISDAGLGGLVAELVNGDIDRDNTITVFDYDKLSTYFDLNEIDPEWSTPDADGVAPRDADLDGDGSVTVFDYDILSRNFDRNGDA